MKDNEDEIKYCNCQVPLHLHGTCCGWMNAKIIVYPKNENEIIWQIRTKQAQPHINFINSGNTNNGICFVNKQIINQII